MSKFEMKPLVTTQRVFTLLSICPADENTGKFRTFLYVMFSGFCMASMVSAFIASLVFVLTNKSTDMEASLFASLQIFSISALIYLVIVSFILRCEITSIFDLLAEICDKYKNADSAHFLIQANNTSERFSKLYFKFIPFGFFIVFMSTCVLLISICCFIQDESNFSDYLFDPLKFVLPWNQKTVFGYFCEMCFGAIVSKVYLIVTGVFLTLFISLCLYHQAFYKMFRHSLLKLECPDKNRNPKEILRDLIQFHNSVKSFFLETAEVYSPFVIVLLISYMIFIAGALFQLDTKRDTGGFGLVILMMNIVPSLLNLFVYCFLGKLATDNFGNMTNGLYESNWRDLPVDVQQYFVIMLQNAQIPMNYHGFGVAILNLETFTKLLKAIFTYYIMFKTVTMQ